MQSFQGSPFVVPTFGTIQPTQQQVRQPTMTDISVSVTPQQARERTLTAESIRRHLDSAIKKGPNYYWKVLKPGQDLKLSGALAYVTAPRSQHARSMGDQQFVYWPRFRVAGTIRNIVDAFRASGAPEWANLTEQEVANEAINPLNPVHAQHLQQMAAQTAEGTGATGGARQPAYSLEQYISIGKALQAQSRGLTTVGEGAVAGAGAPTVRRGGRDAELNRQSLIQEFGNLMGQALNLPLGADLPSILNVTGFDSQRFTKVTRGKPPGPRATAIRPSVVINGRRVAVPISAQPGGASNFEAFVQSVVAPSQYGQLAPQILQSFREQLQQKQSVGPGLAQGMMPQQITGGFQPAATVVGTQLQLQQGLPGIQLQQGTQAQLAQQGTQFPTVQLGQQGTQFPTVQLGQQSTQFPTVQLGQQGTQFPTVQFGQGLPGQQGLSLPTVQPGIFQSGPQGIMSQLQQGAASPRSAPGSPGSSGAASPGTPRAGASGGFQMPTFGQSTLPTTSLPGMPLPTQSTQLPGIRTSGTLGSSSPQSAQLPSLRTSGVPSPGQGLATLPSVNPIQIPGSTAGFPQIPLPGTQ